MKEEIRMLVLAGLFLFVMYMVGSGILEIGSAIIHSVGP